MTIEHMHTSNPAPYGLYDPSEERDSCGVGFVAATDGKPSRRVVEAAIDALRAVWHRGAVAADGKTGDGAGIHLQIPQDFFHEQVDRTGHAAKDGLMAVGMVFLPRTDLDAQETCRALVETEILNAGHYIYGWRRVPIDVSIIGERAQDTRPEIEQVMIANNKGISDDEFERELYLIRRRIEKAAIKKQVGSLYICSLSCRSVIYKGLFLAEQLSTFYPDLADERFTSNYAIYHQRYSTNTFPTWWLAQPFRSLAHNGEINTIKGNKNWMKSHEIRMASIAFGENSADIRPVIQAGSSDSAALDAVFEVMTMAGRSAPMVKTLLIPEAWFHNPAVPDNHRAMYTYANSVMEPWDGPAAIAATDGKWVIAGTDRNGLRPARFARTNDGLIVVGSETGMVQLDPKTVVAKGQLDPGQMIGVNLDEGAVYYDEQLKDNLADKYPYDKWISKFRSFKDIEQAEDDPTAMDRDELKTRQIAAGLSHEDLEQMLQPMVNDSKEPLGSMGDDTPTAVLSKNYRPLSHFFKQKFSQVTNPPIDSLRERRVMRLTTRFGNLGNVLDTDNPQKDVLILRSPIVMNRSYRTLLNYWGDKTHHIDCTFDPKSEDLRHAIDRVMADAEKAARAGKTHLVLSDEAITRDRAPLPLILVTGALNRNLTVAGLRTDCSINVRSAECLDPHYAAVLIGVGASAVNPYLSEATIRDRHARGLCGTQPISAALASYKKAMDEGLYKIISKMGISVLSSYRGGCNFEAVGLSRAFVSEFFPGTPSKISGIGLGGIEKMLVGQHALAFEGDENVLSVGGYYNYRASGEVHGFDGPLLKELQTAVIEKSYDRYKKWSKGMAELPPISLRDLLAIRPDRTPIPVDQVESVTEIRKRFVVPGMSMGAVSPEAHQTMAIAMNRIGAKVCSGEGGEDPRRFRPFSNGDNANSTIKQVASGRFGVTAEYLSNCDEIEIKVAQGAKPGEGGQLPGFKVSKLIARLRHSTPGVMLISPPPHHDIYSIEDLAQLIFDLKNINPKARVCVKLVASAGIGTIAAGVVKAGADVINISGHSGGTGASPLTSIKHAGAPWELGLAEVNQVLTLNQLRDRVKLRVDGGLKTGRDIVIATLLGAEEFGIGTTTLVAMGCLLVRQCHNDTCPVGICTQDERLRKKFEGTADRVVNLFTFLAQEVRETLAELGLESMDEIVGRTELLKQFSRGEAHLDDLDMNPLLAKVDAPHETRICQTQGRNEVPEGLDHQMIKHAHRLFEKGEKMQLSYTVRNTDRAVGTRFSSELLTTFGASGLPENHVEVRLEGSAGQSLGAFAVKGLRLVVEGDSNDYVGKGLSGANIVVYPQYGSLFKWDENSIIGNTCLYGATSGSLFAAGHAGERFAVRNSGAVSVIEGCGANACEYMTGGTVVVLGRVGPNFAAGMTGGMAFVLDEDGDFDVKLNPESVHVVPVEVAHWKDTLKGLVMRHHLETQSPKAKTMLDNWDEYLPRFWQIVPKEVANRLSHPFRLDGDEGQEKAS